VRTLCAVVLVFEAVVIALAIPVAVHLAGMPPATAAAVWGSLALAALALAALQRFTWAFYGGSLLQAVVVGTAVIVPGMGGLVMVGLLFTGLWITAIVLGSRVEGSRAGRGAAEVR
jgi:hypothetical protein